METNIPLVKVKDFSDFNGITLLLGRNCNMKCRHCSQTPVKNMKNISLQWSNSVKTFIYHFIDYSINHPKEKELRKISFWGGEPLLYWDMIQNIILELYSKYGDKLKETIVFTMVSNGLFLDDEKVDFINQFQIEFGLSYDAPHPWAVRDYISDEICELANKIDNLYIYSTCFNRYNCDLLLARKCLEKKFPFAKGIYLKARILKSFNFPEDILDFDWDEVRRNFKKLRISAQLGDRFALNFFMKNIPNVKNDSIEKTSYRVLGCTHNFKGLSLTLDGRCSFCSDLDVRFGNLNDTFNDIKERVSEYSKTMESPECNTCKHADICRKHCLVDMKNKDGSFATCHIFWWPLFGIIKEQFMYLVKPISSEDIIWYRNQEELMERQVQDFLQEGQRYKK